MNTEKALAVFEGYKIRRSYDEKSEIWYFSIVDVVGALTDSVNPRDYWFKMKIRVKTEAGIELSTICRQFKLKAPDGKMRATDCTNAEGLLRIIQSIPSPKAEPFKQWLAKVGYERIQDMSEAELIFTALAELSTRQIAESVDATGMSENAEAGKQGGSISKKARLELEQKTGRNVVTGENFLPPASNSKEIS